MTSAELRGFVGRPAELPIVDGILHAALLPPVPAYELSAALRRYQEPFVGVTTEGSLPPDALYKLVDTGVSAKGAVDAAHAFLAALPLNQRMVANLPMDSAFWRLWTNALPVWTPTGARLESLPDELRQRALEVIEASLSRAGYETVRNAMRLNGALGELIDEYRDSLTEYSYYFTIFGYPELDQPWGWQLMGHHVDVHCVFIGTQLVLAPVFLGAEPTFALSGSYAGVRVLDNETSSGLDLRRALTTDQEESAVLGRSVLSADLPPELAGPFNGRHVSGAGQDNLVLPYEGIRGADLTNAQCDLLLALVRVYLDRLPREHAELKLRQVEDHLDETRFAWRGLHGETSAFYYRVHSPVLLIEYDNHPGIFLNNDEPERFHVHTIVREPNGNDYGRSLLAQHYAAHHS
jgi:hypothetical protein